jgi:DNA modification methylase
MAYPTNVLHFGTECGNKGHSAAFPTALPDWFIRLFTERGDIVLDPFIGSGTTAVAAKRLDRRYVGIELIADYIALANQDLQSTQTGIGLSK